MAEASNWEEPNRNFLYDRKYDFGKIEFSKHYLGMIQVGTVGNSYTPSTARNTTRINESIRPLVVHGLWGWNDYLLQREGHEVCLQ